MDFLSLFLGRLHPVAVHLPIGILLLLAFPLAHRHCLGLPLPPKIVWTHRS